MPCRYWAFGGNSRNTARGRAQSTRSKIAWPARCRSRPRRAGFCPDVRSMPRLGWTWTARPKWGGVSVSTALGSRQLQQRRRNEPPSHCGRLCHGQYADRHRVQRPRSHGRGRLRCRGLRHQSEAAREGASRKGFSGPAAEAGRHSIRPARRWFQPGAHKFGPFARVRAKVQEAAKAPRNSRNWVERMRPTADLCGLTAADRQP
jgi:hypothetical protein